MTRKYQVAIPRTAREKANFKMDDKPPVRVVGGSIVLEPVKPERALEKLRSILTHLLGGPQLMDTASGYRKDGRCHSLHAATGGAEIVAAKDLGDWSCTVPTWSSIVHEHGFRELGVFSPTQGFLKPAKVPSPLKSPACRIPPYLQVLKSLSVEG